MASNLIVEVLAGAVIGGTSILYAAVGESYTESAGVGTGISSRTNVSSGSPNSCTRHACMLEV